MVVPPSVRMISAGVIEKYLLSSITTDVVRHFDEYVNFFKTIRMNLERFSNYIFPGEHERNNVSCDVDTDCIRNDTDINTVECKRIRNSDEYKVCVCKEGWFLNPELQKCGE